MKRKSLLKVDWEGVLAQHMYYRVPLEGKKVIPETLAYEKAAREYMAAFPQAVPDAIEKAVSKWADRDAPIENVLPLLVPPLLDWARTVKGMELNDHEGALYPRGGGS